MHLRCAKLEVRSVESSAQAVARAFAERPGWITGHAGLGVPAFGRECGMLDRLWLRWWVNRGALGSDDRLFEFAHAMPERTSGLGQALGAEDEEHDHQQHREMGGRSSPAVIAYSSAVDPWGDYSGVGEEVGASVGAVAGDVGVGVGSES